MAKQRNDYIDFIKGIVITLVVLGHCISIIEYHYSDDVYLDKLFKLIYTFHMPILIAISGYYSYHSVNKKTLFSFTKTRFNQLIIPMLIWCIIQTIIILLSTNNSNIEEFFKILFNSFIYQYWFIWAIFVYSIFISILNKLKMDNIIILIISILLFTLVDTKILSFHLIKTCIPFFIIGYLLAKTDINLYISLCKKYITPIIIMSFICFLIWNNDTYMYNTPSSLIKWKITIFRIFAGTVTSISFMIILYYIYKRMSSGNKVIKMFSNIGKVTLGIYLSHSVIFTVLIQNNIIPNIKTEYSVLYIIPSILYGIIFWYISLFIKKNKVAAFLLLGKK